MEGCLAITTTTILVHQQILALLDIATACGHRQLGVHMVVVRCYQSICLLFRGRGNKS
jgi:hypothetical protein